MNRRIFLARTSAAVSTGLLGFPSILRGASPNSALQVACIGCGGRANQVIPGIAAHPQAKIVAMCDVDDARWIRMAEQFPQAARFRDWRELLRQDKVQFDAVAIATPDHMHAPIAVSAIRAGKHVYLEKPMASTPYECRVIAQEAARAGVITQLGNQGRSSIESRMTVALLQSGVIGRIKEVILWENKPLTWWPRNTGLRPAADPIPAGFDWDLWLGVREPRPFLEHTYQPASWRAWTDFGSGELGDMGVHHFDITYDALQLTAPLRVRQLGERTTGPLWGKQRVVEMIFPGNRLTAESTLKVTWHDGGIEPDRSKITLPKGFSQFPLSANTWIGERGSIFKLYGSGRPFVLPEEIFPPEKYPRDFKGQDHFRDWVDAIFSRRKACADFSHGGPLTETVLVGALADRYAGEWLEWDSAKLAFRDHAEANRLVRRRYRRGWNVPGLG